MLDAGVGVSVQGFPKAGVVEREHVDRGDARRRTGICPGRARQLLVDIARAVPVDVREHVHELDARAVAARHRPQHQRFRLPPCAQSDGGRTRDGGRNFRDLLPQHHADRFARVRSSERHAAPLPGPDGPGGDASHGRRYGLRLLVRPQSCPAFRMRFGQPHLAAFGRPEVPYVERQRQLPHFARCARRPLGAAGALEHDVAGIVGEGRAGEDGEQAPPHARPAAGPGDDCPTAALAPHLNASRPLRAHPVRPIPRGGCSPAR